MTEEKPENVGVSNPYALAEVRLRRSVAWDRVDDPRELLQEVLGMSYENLFDPKNNSPLYTGLRYRPETKGVERVEEPPAVGGLPEDAIGVGAVVWKDPGEFFEEATELTDPVQGAVPNCYFIAALSSVAWARTYVIAQKTRGTGIAQQQFVDMIEFYKSGSKKMVEVTERLPVNPLSYNLIFARSSEPGEIWPAVYEKAYAKWKTGHAGDTPDISKTGYGDPVGALRQLTGETAYYYWTKGLSAEDIWKEVKKNSASYKTFNPMVAWTYSSGDVAPDGVNYSDACLVANHAYSILGWAYADGQKYIVLRNPWGRHEACLNVYNGNWVAWDAPYYGGNGWWRPIHMANKDGIFALRADTFKKHFSGFGLVKK